MSGLKKEPFFVFLTFLVCLDCGFLQSQLSSEELNLVKSAASAKEAAG